MSVDPSTHRAVAIEANNATWELLGRPEDERTPADAEEMTRRAYAAAYHWDRAEGSGPANTARADWLLARVWAVRGEGTLALHHARRCLHTCDTAGLTDFDLAYAHEAMARALACLGDAAAARRHLASARAVPVADPEDRALLEADLTGEPWFGPG